MIKKMIEKFKSPKEFSSKKEISSEPKNQQLSEVIVYTTPNCTQCIATTKELDKKQITYSKIDLSKDEESMKKVQNLGYKQAPIIFNGEDHWSGFRPDKISTIK